jgi:hypothetical protein
MNTQDFQRSKSHGFSGLRVQANIRSTGLVAALVLTSFIPARIDNRVIVFGWSAFVIYANWLMLAYSPLMDWRPVAIAGILQGAGLGTFLPALTKTGFSTLDPKYRQEGTALFAVSPLWQHHRRRGRPDLLLPKHSSHALGARQGPHALPRRCSCHGFNRPACACRAQLHDQSSSGGRRCHRPVQNSGDRHASREPSRTVSPRAPPG